MSDFYSIEYSVATAADGRTKTCSVKWTFPNFLEFIKLKMGHQRYLCTNNTDFKDKQDEDTKFLFKIEFLGINTDLIRIYYLAPVPMCLKYQHTNISGIICGGEEYSMVHPNKWQFMLELAKEKLSSPVQHLNWPHSSNTFNPRFGSNISTNLNTNNYMSEKKFSLNFNFTINKEIKVDPYYESNAELNSDLENLLNNSIYSDVTMKSAEGAEFQSHKVVLAIRSPVLKAHFEHKTVESVTNVIDTSFETEILQEVLRYIYTDNAPKVDEMPEKLLEAADFYQLNRLKYFCEVALAKKLTVDNVIETLKLADKYSAKNLKKMTIDFICNGRAELVMETKGWMDLEPGPLTKTLCEVMARMKGNLSQ